MTEFSGVLEKTAFPEGSGETVSESLHSAREGGREATSPVIHTHLGIWGHPPALLARDAQHVRGTQCRRAGPGGAYRDSFQRNREGNEGGEDAGGRTEYF